MFMMRKIQITFVILWWYNMFMMFMIFLSSAHWTFRSDLRKKNHGRQHSSHRVSVFGSLYGMPFVRWPASACIWDSDEDKQMEMWPCVSHGGWSQESWFWFPNSGLSKSPICGLSMVIYIYIHINHIKVFLRSWGIPSLYHRFQNPESSWSSMPTGWCKGHKRHHHWIIQETYTLIAHWTY